MNDNIMTINIPQGRASGTLSFTNGGGGVVSLLVEWSSTPNTSANTSTVSATMSIYGNISGTCLTGSHLTINGNAKSYNTKLTASGTKKNILTTHSVTVPHNSDGTKTITISGALVWNGTMWNGSSVSVSTLSGSGNVTLDTINVGTAPTNPTVTLNKTGTVEGNVIATGGCTVASAAGTVYYKFAYSINSGTSWTESAWQTGTTITYNITNISRGSTFQIRSKAKNDKGESAWSSVKTVKANSLPSKVTNITYTPTYPINSLAISWTAATDADNQTITYKVYISKNGTWSQAGTTTSTSYTYNSTSDAYGTKYKIKIEAHDTLGAYSTSAETGEILKPNPPSAPTFSTPDTTYYESTVPLKWTASNFYTVAGKYVIEQKIGTGNWTQIATPASTVTTLSNSITSVTRGTTIQYRIKATNDAGQESAWSTSRAIKRNNAPTGVTNIKPANSYAFDTVAFSWTAATDADGHAITYKIYVSKNSGAYTLTHTTTSTSFTWVVPTQDAGATTYKFRIVSEDTLGATTTTEGPTITKPTPPTKPTNLGPAAGIYENYIPISWTHSTWYNQSGNYIIEISVNGTLNRTVTVSNTRNEYTFSLSSVIRGAKITYRICARNSFNQQSEWVSSTVNLLHNRLPNAPTVTLPLANKTIYTKRPKIVLRTSTEPDGQTMTINVKHNNTTYNSLNNAEYFSKQTLGNNEYVIFKFPQDLAIGSNSIEITANDGLINSAATTLTVTVRNSIAAVTTGDIILASHYNNRVTAINALKSAYGLTASNLGSATSNTTLIDTNTINLCSSALKEIMNTIDGYHSGNKLSYVTTSLPNVNNSTIITANHFNSISNAISQI